MLQAHLSFPSSQVYFIGKVGRDTGALLLEKSFGDNCNLYAKAFINSKTKLRGKRGRTFHKITILLIKTTTITAKELQRHIHAVIQTAVVTVGCFNPDDLIENSLSSTIYDSVVSVAHILTHRHFVTSYTWR